MSKRASLQKRAPEVNSITTMSASAKRKTLIRALTMPRSQNDDYHLLSREQQVVLVRLCTGHNRLYSRMHGKAKLEPSPNCACVEEDQTTEHDLQRCPLHKATRESVGLSAIPRRPNSKAARRSWRRRAALIAQSANAKEKADLEWHALFCFVVFVINCRCI